MQRSIDGFEAVLDDWGLRLLEMLTDSRKKDEENDPLLLIMGSRKRLFNPTSTEQNSPFEEQTSILTEDAIKERAKQCYEGWQRQLPDRRKLGPENLYLPLWLRDFGLSHTFTYLHKLSEHEQLLFEREALIREIYAVSHGHPLTLTLVANTLKNVQSEQRYQVLSSFEEQPVPPMVAEEHDRYENIGDYLSSKFLLEVFPKEMEQLIGCATPRALDISTLR